MEKWETIFKYSPYLKELQELYGEYSLKEYLSCLRHVPAEEIEPSSDVLTAVYRYAKKFCTDETASEAVHILERTRLLFTADHHGIEYFAQSVQGNFLYEMWLEMQMGQVRVVPVFSGGTVNLGSVNYPRGITLYSRGIYHLPVHPYRQRTEMVGMASPFTMEMVERARLSANLDNRRGRLSEKELETINLCLDVYNRKEVLELDAYGAQAVRVNQYLSEMLHKNKCFFLYIELEEIVRELLIKDLSKEKGITEGILFSPSLCKKIIRELNGISGCWFCREGTGSIERGTHFFWGTDKNSKKRYPLYLTENWKLCGKHPAGQRIEWGWDKETCISLLKNKEITPGIFLDFLELIFLRDFTPAGGCFQGEYLTQIKMGLDKCLNDSEYGKMCGLIRNKKCRQYLSGPIIFTENREEKKLPMGMCELLGRRDQIEEMRREGLKLSFNEAQENGKEIFYQDIVPKKGMGTKNEE